MNVITGNNELIITVIMRDVKIGNNELIEPESASAWKIASRASRQYRCLHNHEKRPECG